MPVGQRVFGMALGYEDLNDHEQLRHDPVLGALLGKLTARRSDCAPLVGKSTLNRLELQPAQAASRYHKIRPDPAAIEALWVELFLDAHPQAPSEIILDLDATDDPLHGHQEGRFFHGYYDGYCYLPLYIFCGEQLLVAKLRRANIDGAAGAREEVARYEPAYPILNRRTALAQNGGSLSLTNAPRTPFRRLTRLIASRRSAAARSDKITRPVRNAG